MAAPTYDNSQKTSAATPASITLAHVMSATANGIILAQLSWFDSSGKGDPTSIKYAGVSLTKSIANVSGSYSNQWWYLINPATGNNDMVVTWSGAINDNATLITYSATGAKQSAQPDSTGHNEDASNTAITANITTVLATTLLVDGFLDIDNTGAPTAGASQTQRNTQTSGNGFLAACSEKVAASAGATTMSYTKNGVAGRLLEIVFAIAPFSTVSGTLATRKTLLGVGI